MGATNVFRVIGLLALGCVVSATPLSAKAAGDFVNHGAAVAAARMFAGTVMENRDGERLLLAWIGDHTDGTRSLLMVDLDTGEHDQLAVSISGRDTARGTLISSRNRWYSQFGNRFFEFCPDTKAFTAIEETEDRRSYALVEDEEGLIWGVQHPGASVTSFDPDTGTLTEHGPIHDEDWPQYARHIALDDDGWLYAAISVVETQIAAYHTRTGERRAMIDADQRERGASGVRRGVDGEVYGRAPGWGWHRLRGGHAEAIDEDPPDAEPAKAGRGLIVDEFSDGSHVEELNVPARWVRLVEADGSTRTIDFDYETAGARVYAMIPGPEGTIYGGTGHPTHLFYLDPATGTIEHDHMYPGGHFNALAFQGSHLYAAHYAGGGLYRHDLRAPWDPGVNPERVLDSARELTRPSVLLAHPDGRHLVMAGSPRGGRAAAGLSIFDVDEMQTTDLLNEDLLPHQNTVALLPLEDGEALLGATTTQPGTGGQRQAEVAELYVLDWQTREVVWHEAVLEENEGFRDMIFGPEGLVYGFTTDARLFVFDPESRELVHEADLQAYGTPSGSQAPRMMVLAADDRIYALFREGIVVVEPGDYAHRMLAESPVDIRAGIVAHDGRLYFASRAEIWSYGISQ